MPAPTEPCRRAQGPETHPRAHHALTRAAMLTETGLPAILAPSEQGEALYRRLGFDSVGELSIWVKEGPGP